MMLSSGAASEFKYDTYADAHKELIEVDVTVAIGVEKTHNCVSLGASDLELDLTESTVELFPIDLVVSVERVEVSESSSETADGLGSSGLDLGSDSLKN
jgi:hypothetical protein